MKITKSQLNTKFTGQEISVAEDLEEKDKSKVIAANVEEEIKSDDSEISE